MCCGISNGNLCPSQLKIVVSVCLSLLAYATSRAYLEKFCRLGNVTALLEYLDLCSYSFPEFLTALLDYLNLLQFFAVIHLQGQFPFTEAAASVASMVAMPLCHLPPNVNLIHCLYNVRVC